MHLEEQRETVAVGRARNVTQRSRAAAARVSDRAVQGVLLAVILVGILVYFQGQNSNFLTQTNLVTVLATAAVIGIVSIGQVTTIVSGGFDLSVSGVVPLGSVLFALLLNAGHGLVIALTIVVAAGLAVGVFNGIVITMLKISPLIATLGTMSVASGIALTLAGGVSVPFTDVDNDHLTRTSIASIPNHVWILLALGVAAHCLFRYTVFGRQLFAVGGSPEASRLAGIRTKFVTTLAYALSGSLAALAGAIVSSQLLTGVGTAGSMSGLSSIAAVVLGGAALTGGTGGIPGTFVGVIILAALSNGMSITQVPSFYQQIATGVVLLVAVALSQIGQFIRRA